MYRVTTNDLSWYLTAKELTEFSTFNERFTVETIQYMNWRNAHEEESEVEPDGD